MTAAATLLDEIECRLASPMVTYKENATEDAPRLANAVAAVLALHQPLDALDVRSQRERQVCTGCGTDDGNWQVWPCPTVSAITRALQVQR